MLVTIAGKDIALGLENLGLKDQTVEVHSSLSSFGHVTGGARSVTCALLGICRTVLVPTFSEVGRTTPPPGDRPLQNGTNYGRWLAGATKKKVIPFDPDTFGCDSAVNEEEMGIISKELLRQPATLRSNHPSVSWAASGKDTESFLHPHHPDDPNAPLKELLDRDGRILLLGVTLRSCTAVHLAEEVAGRRPFIRWTLYKDGTVRRMREYGCSDGFCALEPHLKHLVREAQIGSCRARAYPIREFVEICAQKIKESPSVTICSDRCGRCLDAVKGGPAD